VFDLMVYLGIETSGMATGLALVQDGDVLATTTQLTQAQHNEVIFGLLDSLFASAGVRPDQLSGIGVSIGPGMFTSLRVGLAVAKGLALAHSIPVKGIVTLDGLMLTSRARETRSAIHDPPLDACHCSTGILPVHQSFNLPVLALIDARRGEVYCALYQGRERQGDYQVKTPKELAGLVSGKVAVCGSGLRPYRDIIEAELGPDAVMLDLDHPAPEVIAAEAGRWIAQGKADDVTSLAPLYLRRTDAELRRASERNQTT
jgi:tRNA threonylcarbamoyladenosine biosynthesis protein TsaB